MPLRGKKILLIDDSKFMLHHYKAILEKYNAKTVFASSGDDALKILETMELLPDLILCDIIMPCMNGYEFRDKLRENERLKHIPIIFLSANAIEEPCLNKEEYIKKPFQEEVFIAKVKTALGLR
jgi:CheY-like chemotaxis protein